MDIIRTIYFTTLLLFVVPNMALASAVNYDESISGDIENNSPYYLDFGSNSFNGTVNVDYYTSTDFDKIVFVLPASSFASFTFSTSGISAGGEIVDGSATWSLEELASLSDATCGMFCTETNPAIASQEFFSGDPFDSPGIFNQYLYDFENIPLLTHDIYALHTTGFSLLPDTFLNMSYTAQIEVHPVPIPSGIAMFFSGLVLLVTRAW